MAKKIKIAVVVPKYGLAGGAEHFAFELTERIAQNQAYDIHVFANQWKVGNAPVTFHKVPILTFPKWLTTISFAYFTNRMISKYDFDLIHTHDRIFSADLCTLHSIPHRLWVKEQREKKFLSLFDIATCWVENRMFGNSRSKLFMPVSSIALSKTLQEYKIDQKKLQIIPPGVSLEKFCPPESEMLDHRRKLRQQFGFNNNDVVIIFVGMNFEIKGLDVLLSATAEAIKNQKENTVKILVVGKGNSPKYKKIAAGLGIAKHIAFTGVRADVDALFQAADIFAMLSKFDTFGMVVTEAMASGLPVIISSNVGAKDIIEDGKNGFIVEKNDALEVAKKILFLMEPKNRLSMVGRAKKTAEMYSWDKTSEKVAAIYNKFSQNQAT